MMNRNKRNPGIWLALLAASLAGTQLQAVLTSPQSPLSLERKADLVVVGGSGGAVEQGNTLTFSLQVSRVIKGDATLAGASIPALWTSAWMAGSSGSLQDNGIWFLRRTADAWNVIPVVQGAIDFNQTYYPVPAGPILSACAYQEGASADDKLAAETGSGIEAGGGYVSQFCFLFESGLLDELKSPAISLLYQRLASSMYADKRLLGLSGLIRQGDATALNSAAQTAAADQTNPAEGALLSSIRAWFRSADPAAVNALGTAATDPSDRNTAFRESAAHALAAIHTAAALPFLAVLLDDSDVNLRVEAVGGIGSFANGLAVQTRKGNAGLAHLQLPAVAPYKTADTVAHFALGGAIAATESFYVPFWKSWWARNRATLGY